MTRTVTWIDADDQRYPLTFSAHAVLRAGAMGLEAAPVEVMTDERAGDGASLSAVRAPTKSVILPIHFDDLDLLDEMVETFIGRPSRIEMNNGARVRELIDVYYVGGLEGDGSLENDSDYDGGWRNRVVELKALDPYWYGPTETAALGVPQTPDDYNAAIGYNTAIPYNGPGGGISAGTSYDEAVAYNVARPYDGGAIITLPITSRVGAWPIITVHGPANFFQVTHLRTGQTVRTRTGASIGAGADLILDSRPTSRTVTLRGSSAWGELTPDSDLAMKVLADDGLAIILGGTNADSYVHVEWRQRWRMP